MALTAIDSINFDVLRQFIWLNRNEMIQVVSKMTTALNGTPHISNTVIVAGKSILFGTNKGGMTRSEYEAISAHSVTQLEPFSIEIDGNTITVVWDHTTPPAVTGQDLFDDSSGHHYLSNIELRFLTV